MGQQEEADKISANVSSTMSEHAGDLGGAMGGGCSPALATQATSALAAVQGVAGQITSALSGAGIGSLLGMDDSLKKIYDNAKTTNQQALYNEYIAEKNYVTNKYGSSQIQQGTTEYNDLLVNRYNTLGNNELVELNTKHVEINSLIMDFIKVIGEQNIAVTNMQKVMEDVIEDNKHLLNAINGGKSDLYTYNRKSMYESKLKDTVENWTLIPEIIYWTLVILWVCIVMFYLKNVTLVSVGILIGLILYPYFSTPVFLWVLGIIQSIWNFIFMAVHNRISA
jgi:hypothetical protein